MKVPVWSYTFLSTYDRCPKQAAAKYVNRNYPYEAENEALRFGNHVHKAMEDYIEKGQSLPTDVQQWEKFAQRIVDSRKTGITVRAEMKFGVRRNYEPCGFFDNDVYGRGKLDVTIMQQDSAVIFDWKSGKPWEDPLELKIGAVFLKAMFPSLDDIVGAYCWLKEDRWGKLYQLNDTEETKEWIDKTMEKAAASNFWTPKKNALCGWCALKDCPYYKERKDDNRI